MGILNNIKDGFNKAEFTVAPQKKLKTISADFLKAFDLQLAFYKGVQLADPNLTLNQLNQKTTAKIDASSKEELKIKASMKVGEAENLFKKVYGLTVQIKDPAGKVCVDNKLTIGQAARGE